MANHYVYVIRCKDNTLYTGYTTDIERRLRMHERGKGAKYTRGRGPFTLEWHESYVTKSEALQAERAFKSLSRLKKEQYIKERRGEQIVSAKKL